MKDKRCFICKYQGKITLETTLDHIYKKNGSNQSILLCYHHSVELFKIGQTNFMMKYRPNFANALGFEDDTSTLNVFALR